MKKNIISSVILSLIINLICLLINLIFVISFNTVPLGVTISGGEWIGRYGFGFLLEQIYPLGVVGDVSSKIMISLNLESFLIPFIVVFATVLIFKIIINNRKNKAELHKK